MKILVTGGAGFIGGSLIKRLVSMDGRNVLVVDRLRWGSRDSRPAKAEFRRVDLRDSNALAKVLRGCEIVFHLAAQSNVIGAVAHAGYSLGTNVVGTYNVLQAATAAE